MSPDNVIDLASHRDRRMARRAADAALARIFAEARRALESQLVMRSFDAMADIVADGLPRQSMGEPGGGGHGDPTLGAVLANERVVATMRDAAGDLERAEAYFVHALRQFDNVASSVVPPAEAEPAGAGHCQRCGVWVAGTANDRIKSGYCERCYKAWKRSGMPDRVLFNGSEDGDEDQGA